MAAKQKELEGFERPKIQALEDLAEVYVKSRNKRMKATEAEVADKAALIEGMKKHKQTTYKLDSGEVVIISSGKPSVKVTDPEESEEEEGEEAPKKAKEEAN